MPGEQNVCDGFSELDGSRHWGQGAEQQQLVGDAAAVVPGQGQEQQQQLQQLQQQKGLIEHFLCACL